jgi:hypothetical protein
MSRERVEASPAVKCVSARICRHPKLPAMNALPHIQENTTVFYSRRHMLNLHQRCTLTTAACNTHQQVTLKAILHRGMRGSPAPPGLAKDTVSSAPRPLSSVLSSWLILYHFTSDSHYS